MKNIPYYTLMSLSICRCWRCCA